MEDLKKLRVPLRAKVSRLVNELKGILQGQGEGISREVVEARRITLLGAYESLKEKDQGIMEYMCFGDSTPEAIETESLSCDEYENKVQEILQRIIVVLPPVPTEPSEAGTHSDFNRKRTFKLPKIELKKFNGELKEWLAWWSQFEKIHLDETLHDSDKVQYLVQSMVPGTRAQELVDSFPHSAENYPRMIEALRGRFGKEKLLKQVYVRELLKLVIENNTGSQGKIRFSQLYDRLECHLRALESLNVHPEQMAVFLFPMVESSLPEDLLIAWQRGVYEHCTDSDSPRTELQCLMEFLKKEVESEEQRALVRAGFGIKTDSNVKEKKAKTHPQTTDQRIPTAAGLFAGQEATCIFCSKSHESQVCITAQGMSMGDKRLKVKENKACYICLRIGHPAKRCRTPVRCLVCQRKHVAIMCPNLHAKQNPDLEPRDKPVSKTVENVQATFSSPCSNRVVLQTLQVTLVGDKRRKQVRALLDTGSQRSYILKRTVVELGIKPLAEENLCHVLFGGSRQNKCHKRYAVTVEKIGGGFVRTMELVDEDKICGEIPRVPKGPWLKELKEKGIWVNDLGDETPEIEVLLGSDVLGEIMSGRIVQLQNGLTSVQTRFGWTLMGTRTDVTEESSIGMTVTSMLIADASVPELWKLETIGIVDPVERLSKEEKDESTRQHFFRTVSRSDDGRYSVRLPWVECVPEIPDNKKMAEQRLGSTTRKLISMGHFEEYHNVFQSWLEEGIIEKVPTAEEQNKAYYLPHRAVVKPESPTTPIRPVFDASCKGSRTPSLNECLEKGPNLLEVIPSLLHRFREGRIGVISDIRKAFLQILVDPQDREYLRFLWWESAARERVQVFRHNRVVFGVNSSPFLLGAVIEYHLRKIEEDPDKKDFVSTSKKLRKSLYVDNCVTSVQTVQELERFKNESTQLLLLAKMELRRWEFGTTEDYESDSFPKNTECVPTPGESCNTSVLGYRWNKQQDTLYCAVPDINLDYITKRNILSVVSKIFDPVGFLSPALIEPKLILQEAWAEKCKWDDELSDELKLRFIRWWNDAHQLEKVCIPRNFTGGVPGRVSWQLHTFCDASKDAYATVVYLRTCENDQVSVQLVQAKVRVAPLTRPTIPRMELLACTIGARLTKTIKESLDLNEILTFFWSDSTTALTWIKRNDKWGTFVGNRVKEISRLTNPSNWRHVPGQNNPADLPSRGCSPTKLLESKWWEGPKWLYNDESSWPCEDYVPIESKICEEKIKSELVNLGAITDDTLWLGRRFSSYQKNVRLIAWMRRFLSLLREKPSRPKGDISAQEYQEAELVLLKTIQNESFPGGNDVISSIHVMRTEDGLVRVKSKLVHGDDTFGFRLPVLLPNSHPMVKQLIRQEHEQNGHAGAQYLLGKLRERFWILRGRRAIKSVISSCVRCRRFSAKTPFVDPAPLPRDRIGNTLAFEIVGIDLAGPLFLKDNTKAWIVLFTCAVYRCVHLELITSLSTESFLWAMDRFIKRRGRPTTVYSDNGTNFVGAENIFKSLDWKRIVSAYSIQRIQWKFNPPSAPWWGGWWERLIRTMKDLLKRMLGRSTLCYQGLLTVLCEVEAIMNGRPLTCVNDDQADLVPVTPAMFLQEIPNVEFPELDVFVSKDPQAKYCYLKKLRGELRSRFRKEYLSLLVQRGKEKRSRSLNVGEVVLVGTDNKKRLEWPLAKVEELITGKDGIVRVAKVRTKNGLLIRPVQRLYPLEFQPTSDPPTPLTSEKDKLKKCKKLSKQEPEEKVPNQQITRSGRKVTAPQRYGL